MLGQGLQDPLQRMRLHIFRKSLPVAHCIAHVGEAPTIASLDSRQVRCMFSFSKSFDVKLIHYLIYQTLLLRGIQAIRGMLVYPLQDVSAEASARQWYGCGIFEFQYLRYKNDSSCVQPNHLVIICKSLPLN